MQFHLDGWNFSQWLVNRIVIEISFEQLLKYYSVFNFFYGMIYENHEIGK